MTEGPSVSWWITAALAFAAMSPASHTRAQSYPNKPVRILIGYAPGGAADFTARLLAQRLQMPELLGQPVIVESRAGAGSTIAIKAGATAAPDGYTLTLISDGGLVQSARGAKLGYDIEKDMAPISFAAVGPFVLTVHPLVPAHNAKELIALAKRQPGKLTYGSSGNGSAQHLAGEFFQSLTGTKLLHVAYKGGAQAAVATASGEVEMSFTTVPSVASLLKGGKLRLIGVTTERRASFMPDVPTLQELGVKDYEYSAWYGVLGPAGLPKELVARLGAAIKTAVSTAEIREAFNQGGLDPFTNTPEQFRTFIHNQLAKSAQLVKAAGIPAD
ncbi:MAG: Bug family tripartite tricarboxylate transporter substrate binding protein [Rhodospirillaceae bacterium]